LDNFEPIILYEDNHLLVVVKPHNIPVMEDSSGDEDFLTLLKKYIKARDKKQGNVFLGLVHRLDRPTGGVMVFAKTSKCASRLANELKNGEMKKKYLCIALGEFKRPSDTITHFLKKDEKTNTVDIVTRSEQGAKEASLKYNVIEYKDGLSLVEVELITGRSHQIRVQLGKGLGQVLYGDFKYGDKAHGGRLALFAYMLELYHPTTKKHMKFIAMPDIENIPFKLFDKTIENFVNSSAGKNY